MIDVHAHGLNSRSQGKDKTGGDCCSQREDEHVPVEPGRGGARDHPFRNQRDEHIDAPHCQQEPGCASR